MDDPNPYQAPAETVFRTDAALGEGEPRGLRLHVAWAVVLGTNLLVPLLFGWRLTREHGKVGISLAIVLFLVFGWGVCSWRRSIAQPAIVGGAVVAMSQLMPIAHIVAGIIGFGVAVKLGLASDGNDDAMEAITSELGGFVVTFVTGGILVCASFSLGLLIRLVTPARWWTMRPSP